MDLTDCSVESINKLLDKTTETYNNIIKLQNEYGVQFSKLMKLMCTIDLSVPIYDIITQIEKQRKCLYKIDKQIQHLGNVNKDHIGYVIEKIIYHLKSL